MRQQFTGYERDAETGLDFAQARYYSPGMGRFTSPDPLAASMRAADPQSFNRYAYVSNNPLTSTDPTGLMGENVGGFMPGDVGALGRAFPGQGSDLGSDAMAAHDWMMPYGEVPDSVPPAEQGQAAGAMGAIAGAALAGSASGDAAYELGICYWRLGVNESSLSILRRAVDVAEESGALSNAGMAALTLIEEHGARRLTQNEVYKAYLRADRLLKDTQDAEDIARLRACARIVMKRLAGLRLHDKNFTLFGAVHEFEAKIIEQALAEAEGSVTRAAKLLGLRHQTPSTILNARHKRLLKKRTPARKRLRSIIKKQ